jgi:hypothetical protein
MRRDRRWGLAGHGAVLGLIAAATACSHTDPFTLTLPDTVGPISAAFPRQLTFNPLIDETPSVHGDTLVFSRRDADRVDGDICLAFLPVEGGRLLREACAKGHAADSTRDAWLYPAISPDGRRIAFVRERGSLRGGPPDERALVVAPIDQPDSAVIVSRRVFPTPSGVTANGYRKLTWKGNDTVRFLGGSESLVNGELGGFVPRGVFVIAADAADSVFPTAIPELADAAAYDVGPDGSTVFITPADPLAVYRFVADSGAARLVEFGSSGGTVLLQLTDVAVADSVIAVIGSYQGADGGTQLRLSWADLAAGGAQHDVFTFVNASRLASVAGRRQIVLEAVETSGPDLWLVGFP